MRASVLSRPVACHITPQAVIPACLTPVDWRGCRASSSASHHAQYRVAHAARSYGWFSNRQNDWMPKPWSDEKSEAFLLPSLAWRHAQCRIAPWASREQIFSFELHSHLTFRLPLSSHRRQIQTHSPPVVGQMRASVLSRPVACYIRISHHSQRLSFLGLSRRPHRRPRWRLQGCAGGCGATASISSGYGMKTAITTTLMGRWRYILIMNRNVEEVQAWMRMRRMKRRRKMMTSI